ncbi:MAG: response regulator [Gammaproteobacteria bacterium]|nr:response regulator [Gammaproteobacteria bacterium]
MNIENSNILIVEDDQTTASILTLYLQRLGCSVVATVCSGEQAVEKAKLLSPNVILMDIVLEGTMDGITAAGIITKDSSIPIIYITSHYEEHFLSRVQETVHAGFINKPVREVDLNTAIVFALTEKNAPMKEHLLAKYDLTRSEYQLVLHLLENPDLKSISSKTNTTIHTIRTHLKHIYKKTNTKSKTALVLKFLKP